MYLHTKKYVMYALALALTLIVVLIISRLILHYTGFRPEKLIQISPILEKISPIAKSNAYLMLIIAIVASISLSLNSRLKKIEKEKLSAELAALKMQINPHFLFNTLNNIYATAIVKSPETAEMIERLSEMMRYTMHENHAEKVDLADELQYIENYIELQKLRLEDKLNLEYKINGIFFGKQIAPMVLIPFIENAFKHGINAEENSRVLIEINCGETDFELFVQNNKVKISHITMERSGLGIENTKSRLELIYPTKYQLVIQETPGVFTVNLSIELL